METEKQSTLQTQSPLDVSANVWINANAGSGKTTILIKRFFSLVLNGADPFSILLITYTEVGAKEMKTRLFAKIQHWHAMQPNEIKQEWQSDNEFYNCIKNVESAIAIAKNLYTDIVLSKRKLQISTIHSFCTNISSAYKNQLPNCNGNIMSDEGSHNKIARRIISQQLKLFLAKFINKNAEDESVEDNSKNAEDVVNESNAEDALNATNISNVANQREGYRGDVEDPEGSIMFANPVIKYAVELFLKRIESNANIDTMINDIINNKGDLKHISLLNLQTIFNINTNVTPNEKAEQICGNRDIQKTLNEISCITSKTIAKRVDFANLALKNINAKNKTNINATQTITYIKNCIFGKGTRAISKTIEKNIVDMRSYNALLDEIEDYDKIFLYYENLPIPIIVNKVLGWYEDYQKENNLIDYDDIINNFYEAINLDTNLWLLMEISKLVKHILLDEAQDTNEISWKIIYKISEEFFNTYESSNALSNMASTIFVVGDEKQSIYGFQGANVKLFNKYKTEIKNKCKTYCVPFYELSFNYSYRSSQEILNVVDSVFSSDEMRKSITSSQSVRHISRATNLNNKASGEQTTKALDIKICANKIDSENEINNAQSISNIVTDIILKCIQNGVEESEIMVIAPTRSGKKYLMLEIIESVKKAGIKTGGLDKFEINKHVLYHDIISLCKFAAFPFDDMNLACLLRSVFFGFSIQKLENACLNNELNTERKTLFSKLQIADLATFNELTLFLNNVAKIGITAAVNYIINTLDTGKIVHQQFGDTGTKVMNEFLRILFLKEEESNSVEIIIEQIEDSKITIKPESLGVCFSSVHGAKGKESEVVIIVDVTDLGKNYAKHDRLTIHNDCAILMPKTNMRVDNLQKIEDEKTESKRNEGMRALYVALTRAKKHIYMVSEKPNENSWTGIVSNSK